MSQDRVYQKDLVTSLWKATETHLSRTKSLSTEPNDVLDRTAFEELYSTYLPRVFNYISYKVMNRDAAEDITSIVFERALSKLHTYRKDKGAFSTWLFTIAHNVVVSYLRSKQGQPQIQSLDALPDIVVDSASPELMVAEAERYRRIQTLMRALPEQEQEILALRFGSELSNQEIARMLGLTANNVGVLLYRAVRKLRLAMKEE